MPGSGILGRLYSFVSSLGGSTDIDGRRGCVEGGYGLTEGVRNRRRRSGDPASGASREASGKGSSAAPGEGSEDADLAVVEAGEVTVGGREPRHEPPSKRVVDVLFSLVGLLLTAPAWILIPLAIKLEDGGPVFYRDTRLGKGGEPFQLLKFRTMVPENDLPNVKGHPPEDLVTGVGAFLRPTALDELPQLVNVLRGEMSLVGPRAAPPEEEADDFGGEAGSLQEVRGFEERLSVRPGLTGLAQTRAPRDVSYRTKFRYDLYYVRCRNLWLDLKLIVYSVGISLLGKWPEIMRGDGRGVSGSPAAE